MSKRTEKDRVTQILSHPAGREICNTMRKETWYQLMSTSSDPVMRRLGASVFLAAALAVVDPTRLAWGEKPLCPRCRKPRGGGHRCPSSVQADSHLEARSS